MIGITRWYTPYCDCIFDIQYEEGWPDTKFLAVHRLCKKHQPHASQTYKAEHSQLARQALGYLENIKRRNMERAIDVLNNAFTKHEARDANSNIEMIRSHNERISAEWNQMLSKPHAFDSHIYDMVLKENHEFNQLRDEGEP